MEKILPSLLRLTKVAPLGCTLSFLSKAMPNKVNHEPFRFYQNFSLSFDEGLISFLELKKHHRKKMDERNSHAISSCTHRCTQHYSLCTVYDWTGQRAVMWFNLFGHEAVRDKLKNGLKTPKMHFFTCFWDYVGQPQHNIGWATSVPFTSINTTYPIHEIFEKKWKSQGQFLLRFRNVLVLELTFSSIFID